MECLTFEEYLSKLSIIDSGTIMSPDVGSLFEFTATHNGWLVCTAVSTSTANTNGRCLVYEVVDNKNIGILSVCNAGSNGNMAAYGRAFIQKGHKYNINYLAATCTFVFYKVGIPEDTTTEE